MNIASGSLLPAIAIGLGATLVMDLWAVFLRRAFHTASLDFCLVGRWLRYMPEGVFTHASIARTPAKSAECALGWIAHYALGVVFALALVLVVSPAWLREPTLPPALIFGVVTVAIPFFVMQPSFGLGIAAAKTPDPTAARLRSLMTHAVFGLGLYVSAWALSFLLNTSA
jgi:hypothetical protein